MSDHDLARSAVAPAPEAEGEDSALQGVVWLAEGLDIAMPPMPAVFGEDLEEIALNRLFATDRVLLGLRSPGEIAAGLASAGWPVSGLTLGYLDQGTGGRWFYTLVGARLLINVSLRLGAAPGEPRMTGTGVVSGAHAAMELYLSREANFSAATSTGDVNAEAFRRIICYSDEGGMPRETQATWSEASGLSSFTARDEVFSGKGEAPLEVERVIWI